MSVKKERIETLIKRELAPIIVNRLDDPALNMVTVTDVDLTNDMSYATVYVSFFNEDSIEKGMEALEKAKGMLRTEIAQVLTTRRTPELLFKYDESIHHGAKISEIISKIHEEK